MTDNKENARRQFLRNTVLATMSMGLLPVVMKGADGKGGEECDPTTLDLYGQGPFYTANAPELLNNQLAASNEPGTRLILTGLVKTIDCSAIIPNTLIDAWHANDAGAYDNVGYNLRGKTYSNEQGFYMIETILPGKYLNGASYRPRHIHFKITPPGFPTITTQLYFEGDEDIPNDAAASVTSGTFNATERIIPITLNDQGQYEGTWDIIVNGNGALDVSDLHSTKGVIYSASPNPFVDQVEIFYGVFESSRVSIQIFDIKGQLVSTLDEQLLQPEKYKAFWRPDLGLESGIYFIALKVNDLQVHYLKVFKVN